MNLHDLKSFLDSMRSYSHDLVQKLESGAKLCHYTSLEGALGMLEGGDLWLSHLRYTNDDEELHYGRGMVDRVVGDLERAAGDAARRDFLASLRAKLAARQERPIYIACFCEEPNLLSQWRGYADNGGGVCLEFDPSGLQAVSGPDVRSGLARLWRVFYDAAEQEAIVRECVDYPNWKAGDGADRVDHVVDALQFFEPTFKCADFAGERERRLVYTPDPVGAPPTRFRVRSGMLVPYVRASDLAPGCFGAPKPRLPIASVMVGPGRHRDLNRTSLEMALAQFGYGDVPVAVSTTPFRG